MFCVYFWQRGHTDRLHVRQLLLVFDDGAVEFFPLCLQLPLQCPVLLLLPVHLGVVASMGSPHRVLLVHHLSQLVHSLEAKQHDGSSQSSLYGKYKLGKQTAEPTEISMQLQEKQITLVSDVSFCPEFNTSL